MDSPRRVRSPSSTMERRSPSPTMERRPPSPTMERRSPSPTMERRSPSPTMERRSPSPTMERRSPSPTMENRRSKSPNRKSSRESSVSQKLQFNYSPSANNILADPAQVAFKTSSLALLRAKRNASFLKDEGNMISLDESYLDGAWKVVNFMNQMYRAGKLCDVLLRSSGKDLFAHKIALGAYSTLLAERFAEFAPGEIISIELLDFSFTTVELVLNFVYTTDITVTNDNVEEIYGCSLELGIELLIALCKEHLSDITLDNALFFLPIAERFNLQDILQSLMDFICSHFETIIRSRSFLALPYERLLALLGSDNLSVSSELAIFFAVVNWIDFNRQQRLSLAASLLKYVRFRLIDPETLARQVEPVDHIFVDRRCFEILYDAMRFHALRYSGSPSGQNLAVPRSRAFRQGAEIPSMPKPGRSSPEPLRGPHSPPSSPRPSFYPAPGMTSTPIRKKSSKNSRESLAKTSTKSAGSLAKMNWTSFRNSGLQDRSFQQQGTVLAVGGVDMQGLDDTVPGRCVYCLAPGSDAWKAVTYLQNFTHHHGAVVIGDNLYVAGGAIYNPENPEALGEATSAAYRYNLTLGTWTQLPDMIESRAYFGLVAYGNSLFAVSGENNKKLPMDTIERYDEATNQWTTVARLPSGGRIGAATAVHKGHLYVAGGFRKYKATNPVLDFVECYDIENDRWLAKKPLPSPRCHAGMLSNSGHLILIGGRTQVKEPRTTIRSLADVLVYDDVNDTWSKLTELRMPRHDCGWVVSGSRLCVVGGMKSPSPYCLTSVEGIDLETGEHVDGIPSLPSPTAGLICCSY